MNHYEETILKFSDALGKIDITKEVSYQGKCYGIHYCVCGQRIKKGHLFQNSRTEKKCVVGKGCVRYVVDYLGWKV